MSGQRNDGLSFPDRARAFARELTRAEDDDLARFLIDFADYHEALLLVRSDVVEKVRLWLVFNPGRRFVTRRQLAEEIGSTRETVCRALDEALRRYSERPTV